MNCSAIKIINQFLDAFWTKNSTKLVLDCLDDYATWTGAFQNEEADGKADIASLLDEKIMPKYAHCTSKINDVAEKSISDTIMVSKIKLDVGLKSANNYFENITITILCKNYATAPTIVSVTFSAPFSQLHNNRAILKHNIIAKNYNDELAFSGNLNSEYIASFRLNLTRNTVEVALSSVMVITEAYQLSASALLATLVKFIADKDDELHALNTLDITNLLNSYAHNDVEIVKNIRITNSGEHPKWVTATVRLVAQPATENVICFIYVKNSDSEIILNFIKNAAVVSNCDFVAYVDLLRKNYACVMAEDNGEVAVRFVSAYEKKLANFIELQVIYEDRMECKKYLDSEFVIRKLKAIKNFSFTFRVASGASNIVVKRLRFVAIDSDKSLAVVFLSTENSDFAESKNYSKMMFTAFSMAEQAGEAREQFLSRISHEIMTPIDTILALASYAEKNIETVDAVKKSIVDIKASGKYLEELFSNIIEMADLAGKKVVLNEKEFSFSTFLRNIIVNAQTLCSKYGIVFTLTADKSIECNYIGDTSRLGQALNLVLENRIKNAVDGSSLQMIVSAISRDTHSTNISFQIIDNGAREDSSILAQAFEPFVASGDNAVENAANSSGLGLAISKKLIELMGGAIAFVARTDGCSEIKFNVNLKLADSEGSATNVMQNRSLSDLNIAVIDNDRASLTNCAEILKGYGITALCTPDAKVAITKIKAANINNKNYDIIIMSEKIVNKNYMEVAQTIRNILLDETIIFLLSDTREAVPTYDERLAGISLILKKPLVQSTLFALLENAKRTLNTKRVLKSTDINQIDFNQRRILIVEDHDINYDIIKNILVRRNASVSRAVDGLMVIDMFVNSEENYYSAIIMDIHLPKLDGLTATKKIRAEKRRDAKNIPIIAMTASSAEDDYSASFSAGMNAHLLKPVNPNELITELYKEINFLNYNGGQKNGQDN